MMIVNKIQKYDDVFKEPQDAISFLLETNFTRSISVYDINEIKAYEKANEIYEFLTEYNKGETLKDQILPSCPFGWRGIIGCLGVQCYEISIGTYEQHHECIALFSGWNTSVLDTSKETAEVYPGMKALNSLAMIANML